MSGKVHFLTPPPEPIGLFIRLGSGAHHQLETLQGAGRLPIGRVVAEASQLKPQSNLLTSLREAGAEITLDTRIAELSEPGSYAPSGQWLSFAEKGRPMIPRDFMGEGSRRLAEEVASLAVANRVEAVLVPSHFVEDARSAWWPIDLQLCEHLRKELDRLGGREIRTDYCLITTYRTLREADERRAIVSTLRDLPFENLWLRISGFGAHATPVAVRRYISAVAGLHVLERPIVADYVGGLAGLAAAAFGSSGAIAHGVSEKERFDGGRWRAPRKSGGGGQLGRVYVPAIDRYFKIEEARAILEAKGARRLLACPDRDCCPRGPDDTLRYPKAHFMAQRLRQIADLSRTPEDHRIERFLNGHLAPADRLARQAAKLEIDNSAIRRALQSATVRLDRMRLVLENLDQIIGRRHSRSLPLRNSSSCSPTTRGTLGT